MPDKYGIRVVQKGEDIDFTPPADISYSSEFQSPKVTAPYRDSFQCDALGNGQVIINHPLNYAPVALAFYKTPGQNWKATDNDSIGIETNKRTFVIRTRKNTSEFEVLPQFAGTVVQYKIWLMLDPAQEII